MYTKFTKPLNKKIVFLTSFGFEIMNGRISAARVRIINSKRFCWI